MELICQGPVLPRLLYFLELMAFCTFSDGSLGKELHSVVGNGFRRFGGPHGTLGPTEALPMLLSFVSLTDF